MDVRLVKDVAIGEDGDGHGFLDCSNFRPVSQTLCIFQKDNKKDRERTHSGLASLLPQSPMAGNDLRSSSLKHFGIFNGLFDSWEHAELGGDRYRQVGM